MFEETAAWRLWTRGLDQWRAGKVFDAAATLRSAIDAASPTEFALPEIYGSLGQLLSEGGEDREAEAAFRKALELSLVQFTNDLSPSVVTARYFLADHLRRFGRPALALEVTEPSAAAGGATGASLHCVRALALAALGQRARARVAAALALNCASSAEQRERVAKQVGALLGPQPN